MIVEASRESFAQGSQGVAKDVRVIASPRGFELDEIDARDVRVCIWHGREDANVPVEMAEKAAKMIEGAELRILEGEAHLSARFHHHGELLVRLLS
jgi:pimeloyl-ACP methyl ester carboxylesterase